MKKLLVANRGEIARRIIRTARQMGIATVAVHSDLDAWAPHVREADESVPLTGSAAGDTYLRADLLIDAARRTGAEAIHPGYGFLSENAAFALACAQAGLTFVGPSPEVIEVMGSKLQSKQLAKANGVPVLEGVLVGVDDSTVDERAAEIGFPLLVKASAGGGGRGMRVVDRPGGLLEAIASARREASAAFGDGTVFLERFVSPSRHVEIQVFGDSFGDVVHLFERDCSIQRRHQKLIEESPAPGLDPATRARMGAAAVAVAKAVGYIGAGTVEFIRGPDGAFFFLEMNTRLQVEHPVTEMVTGLDLVREQLLVADGAPLSAEVVGARQVGHAIEARIYAEDPGNDFLPTSGHLVRFDIGGSGSTVRVDSAVASGSMVSTSYDGLLAKVIAHAPTRAEAAATLAGAIAGARIHGLQTNVDLLVRTLREPSFLRGEATSDFLTDPTLRHVFEPLVPVEVARLHAVVAALARQRRNRDHAVVLRSLPSGWRNNRTELQRAAFSGHGLRFDVRYAMAPAPAVSVNDVRLAIDRIWECAADLVDLVVDGVRRCYLVEESAGTWYVSGPDGASALVDLARFASVEQAMAVGAVVAPLPGHVVAVPVAVGDVVHAGDTLVVIEAMKMEHAVRASGRGVIERIELAVGDHVDTGAVLIVVREVSEDHPSSMTGNDE